MVDGWTWRHNVSGKQYHLLAGDPEGEHLRVEVTVDEVIVISHELRSVLPTIQWKDRVMFSVTSQQWLEVAKLITDFWPTYRV